MIAAVTESVAELLAGADGEVAACGLDHQGESVLAWDSETGKPLSPIVVWQDKRSQEILDELTEGGGGGQGAQRVALRPLLLRGQAGLAAAPLRRGEEGPRRWQASDGNGRLLPLRQARSRLRDRAGHSFRGPSSSGSTSPGLSTSASARSSEYPIDVLPEIRDTAGELGTLTHESWPVELPFRGPGGGPAGSPRGRRLRGARPGQGDLRDRGLRSSSRRRGGPGASGWAAADSRLEHRREGRVRARRRSLRGWCDARVDVRHELGIADSPPELSKLAREAESSDGARVLPGLAGIGAPW